MEIKGKSHVYGNNINTDVIIAGKYTKSLNMQDFADHCMEDIDPEFRLRVKPGDVVVAGENFGCGSSREQAPLALKYSGISAVLAKSFARIFFRNAINIGLQVIVCDTEGIVPGDEIQIDSASSSVLVNGTDARPFTPMPKVMQDILECGGLTAYLSENGQFKM